MDPYFQCVKTTNSAGVANERLIELINEVSSREDFERIADFVDESIEEGLGGYWDESGEVYCLNEEECFDSSTSAREYTKEGMSAIEWLVTLEAALESIEKENDENIEDIAKRLTSEGVSDLISLIQESYEEHFQDEEEYNPLQHERMLETAGRNDLVRLFINYFGLPKKEDVAEKGINIDWMPETLIDAFDLQNARRAARELQKKAARRTELLACLEELGPLSYGGTLEFLCQILLTDIPRRRNVLDKLERLIKGWES